MTTPTLAERLRATADSEDASPEFEWPDMIAICDLLREAATRLEMLERENAQMLRSLDLVSAQLGVEPYPRDKS